MPIELGGSLPGDPSTPEAWTDALYGMGYRAANWPLSDDTDDAQVQAFADAAAEADVSIAHVGAWTNLISSDEAVRREAIATCTDRLELADEIGAMTAVTSAGSPGRRAYPHPDSLGDGTLELLADTVREIVDAVDPTTATFALETVNWMPPNTPERAEELVGAVDRRQFGYVFDPVNMLCCAEEYYDTGALIERWFDAVGERFDVCHAKDVTLRHESIDPGSPCTLSFEDDDVLVGEGNLDFGTYLAAMDGLDRDVPLMIEHQSGADAYHHAVSYLRSLADELNVPIDTTHQ